MKLNHKKLTTLLREYSYELPGGVQTEGLPDFTRYYIQEAAKAFMGLMCSDFDNGGMSKKAILSKVIPILAEYDLLDDVDPFYETFLLNNKVEGLLPENILKNNNDYKQALEHINTAKLLLNSTVDSYTKERESNKKLYDLSEKYNLPIEDLKELSIDLKND